MEDKYKTVDDIYTTFQKNNKQFIEEIDKEDKLSARSDTKEVLINEYKLLLRTNDNKKMKFINEIKSGYGNEIKKNPGQIKLVKKPKRTFMEKLTDIIKSIFIKF